MSTDEQTALRWMVDELRKENDKLAEVNQDTIQSILDDGRRQGMLEAAEIAGKYGYGSEIREHAAKLFPKATND